MKLTDIIFSTEWDECTKCGDSSFIAKVDGNTLCNDCLGVVYTKRPHYKKELIPDEIRVFVFERDNYTCQHCGAKENLSVDHIYPEKLGGKATKENCQTLCRSCNSRKGMRV